MNVFSFRQFTLFGSGRLARHLAYYFELLDLPFNACSRSTPLSEVAAAIEKSSHILFAVSDSAIAELAAPLRDGDQVLVHFSGALSVPGVHSAHPLMTFSSRDPRETAPEIFRPWFESIPFVTDPHMALSSVLPGLPNRSFTLAPEKKSLYHALCSLAGNSTHLLWSKVALEFSELGLPPEILAPYLHQVVENSVGLPDRALKNLTGPVARGDWSVVHKHLRTLENQPELSQSYHSYLKMAESFGIEVPSEFTEGNPV